MLMGNLHIGVQVFEKRPIMIANYFFHNFRLTGPGKLVTYTSEIVKKVTYSVWFLPVVI
jgi:hypothetical protein